MDDQKNQIMIAVLTFNVVVMGYQFFFNWGENFGVGKLLLSIIVGCIAGGAAFAVAKMKK